MYKHRVYVRNLEYNKCMYLQDNSTITLNKSI